MENGTNFASKGHQVVLAKRKDLNILDNYQLVMVFMKHSIVHNISQVLFITLSEVHHGFGVTFRCLEEALSVWILTDTF